MGFNKRWLPCVDELSEFLLKHGSKEFSNRYIKSTDAFVGSSASVDFVYKIIDINSDDKPTFYSIK